MTPAVLISRIFAVLAATMLVAAVSLVLLAPAGMTLIQGLAELDPALPLKLQHDIHRHLGVSIWLHLFVPLLVRPVWLVPTGLTLLFAGVAASTNAPTQSPTSTRFRG